MRSVGWLVGLLGVSLVLAVGVAAADEAVQPKLPTLDAGSFEGLRKQILPDADELAWMAVPWRTRLWEAVVEAQELQRPLLIWAMNGHPLGCT